MKTLLILILTLALIAAAFFTRPTEADFRRYFKDHAAAHPEGNWFERTFGQLSTDSFLDGCVYHNRYLWTDIEHDDTIIYTGAFSHWFERNTKVTSSGSTSNSLTVPELVTPQPDKAPAPPTYEVKRGK